MAKQPIMTRSQWDLTVNNVTDQMKTFTRPFVTPLVHEPLQGDPIFGSGTYVDLPMQKAHGRRLITCEHVVRHQPQQHRPFECDPLRELIGAVCSDRDPRDVATVTVADPVWYRDPHQGSALPFGKFATRHAPVPHEVLFFRGLAGENAYLGFGNLDAIVTGYSGQEKPGSGNSEIFEIEWEPTGTKITTGTTSSIAKRVKFDDPSGFSGSLVWNTRFVELGSNLQRWSPADAVVTGLLRRWDTQSKTLLVWRVEHLRSWLSSRPSWA